MEFGTGLRHSLGPYLDVETLKTDISYCKGPARTRRPHGVPRPSKLMLLGCYPLGPLPIVVAADQGLHGWVSRPITEIPVLARAGP